MPTKADLEYRIALLEGTLEETFDLIQDVLSPDDDNESTDQES
jgi:hypothetical protein